MELNDVNKSISMLLSSPMNLGLALYIPQNLADGFLLTDVDKEKILVKRYKIKILSFIQKNKTVYLSDLSREFHLSKFELQLIINELKEEGKIQIVQ